MRKAIAISLVLAALAAAAAEANVLAILNGKSVVPENLSNIFYVTVIR